MSTLSANNVRETPAIPIICKLLLLINIVLFIVELLQTSWINEYCLSPQRTLDYPKQYFLSLFLSNFLHLTPISSGIMGILHIFFNMKTLINIGRHLETEFGSISFLGITLFFAIFVGPLQIPLAMFTSSISNESIGLLSMNQCGIGFSGILFGYFIIYLKFVVRSQEYKIWLIPFVQLIILSVLFRASFIGHLSGIIMGMIYISGFPGCFALRHSLIKKIENWNSIKFLTNRSNFHGSSQQAIISKCSLMPCSRHNNNNINNGISYSQVSNNDENIEMTETKQFLP